MRLVKLGDRMLDANKILMVADNGASCAIYMEGGFSFTHNETMAEVLKRIGWVGEKKEQQRATQ